jgi:hypothetical protein
MNFRYFNLHFLKVFLFISIVSCENRYSGDKKHGQWTEYLDSTFSKEVAIDSAYYVRKVKYNNGYPNGIVSDFYKKNNFLYSEKHLISGPYLKDSIRPEDKITGILLKFDSLGKKITKFEYYDEFGFIDLKKKYVTGFDEIINDPRFDLEFYINNLDLRSNELESFKKFKKRPDLYTKELGVVIEKYKRNQFYKGLIEDDSIGFWTNFLVGNAFSEGAYLLKQVDSLIIAEDQKIRKRREQIQNSFQYQQLSTCKWCGVQYVKTENNGGFHSLRCRTEYDAEMRRRYH